jgi:peroxiredoxin
MIAVGAPAPDVELLRTDGSGATLRELAAGQPAVLFFLRHYG